MTDDLDCIAADYLANIDGDTIAFIMAVELYPDVPPPVCPDRSPGCHPIDAPCRTCIRRLIANAYMIPPHIIG